MKPLNPIMAALVAAASATLASPGLALAKAAPKKPAAPTAKAAAPAGDCLKALDDAGTDAVNALTCLVSSKPEARKDIGERLSAWVQGKEPGRQYLKDDLLKDETLMKAVTATAKDWPEKNVKSPAAVASLYFVIGPAGEELPAWAQVPALKSKFKPKMLWATRFAEAMTSQHWSDAKQVAQTDAANGVIALLNDGAAQAKKILADPRTQKEVADSIAANDTTSPVIPTVNAGRKNPLDNTGAGFGFDDLYRTGAVVARVYGPKDDGYRELSMKIYTVVGDDGKMQNMIGVVDITNPNAPYLPKYFPVTTSGEVKFTLRAGGRPYVLNVDGDNITLARDGVKAGEGSALSASMSRLYTARAEQARTGAILRIPDPAGREYYVMGQGGEYGSSLFFPKDELDSPQSDPRRLRPAAMGPVSMVDNDGVTVPVDWKPGIGKLPDGVNPDGSARYKPFMMVFDAKTKMWKVVEGEGEADPRKKPKDAPAPAGPGNPTTTGPGGGAPATGNGDSADGDQTAAGTTLDQVVELAKKGGWTDLPEANAGFNDEARAKVHIMTGTRGGKKVFGVFFDPSLGVSGNQFAFQPIIGNQPLKEIKGKGRYVVMAFPKMEQYFDHPTFAKYVGGDGSAQPALTWSEERGFQDFDDVEALLDTVGRKYTKVDPKFAETVRARVKKYAPDGGYHLSGKPDTTIEIKVGKTTRQIWPNDISGAGTGDNAGMTTQKGPGTVYQLAGGPDGPFPEKISDGNWERVSADEGTGIALYSGTEYALGGNDGGTVPRKRYSIMVRYKKASGAARSKLITVFGDAKEDNDYFLKPSDLKLQGLKDQKLGDTSILRMYANSTQEKGGIAAYRTPASAAGARDPKANCVGPVVWWGMTKGQAEEACRTDGKAD